MSLTNIYHSILGKKDVTLILQETERRKDMPFRGYFTLIDENERIIEKEDYRRTGGDAKLLADFWKGNSTKYNIIISEEVKEYAINAGVKQTNDILNSYKQYSETVRIIGAITCRESDEDTKIKTFLIKQNIKIPDDDINIISGNKFEDDEGRIFTILDKQPLEEQEPKLPEILSKGKVKIYFGLTYSEKKAKQLAREDAEELADDLAKMTGFDSEYFFEHFSK